MDRCLPNAHANTQFLSTALLTDRRPGTTGHADCSALGTRRVSMDFFNMHLFRVWRRVGEWFPTFRRDVSPSSSRVGSANTHVLTAVLLKILSPGIWRCVVGWVVTVIPPSREPLPERSSPLKLFPLAYGTGQTTHLKISPQGQGQGIPILHRTAFYVRSLNIHLALSAIICPTDRQTDRQTETETKMSWTWIYIHWHCDLCNIVHQSVPFMKPSCIMSTRLLSVHDRSISAHS